MGAGGDAYKEAEANRYRRPRVALFGTSLSRRPRVSVGCEEVKIMGIIKWRRACARGLEGDLAVGSPQRVPSGSLIYQAGFPVYSTLLTCLFSPILGFGRPELPDF